MKIPNAAEDELQSHFKKLNLKIVDDEGTVTFFDVDDVVSASIVSGKNEQNEDVSHYIITLISGDDLEVNSEAFGVITEHKKWDDSENNNTYSVN